MKQYQPSGRDVRRNFALLIIFLKNNNDEISLINKLCILLVIYNLRTPNGIYDIIEFELPGVIFMSSSSYNQLSCQDFPVILIL